MDSYYEQWFHEGEKWMASYRKRVLGMSAGKIIPLTIIALMLVFGGMALLNDGSPQDTMNGVWAGLFLGVFVSLIYLLLLLPGLSSGRMRRNMQRAVSALNTAEGEQELLGKELLLAAKDSSRVLNYEMVGPKSNHTPARFILSPHYVCLWGSSPLVILVRLSDVAEIRSDEENKSAVNYGTQVSTISKFELHTILFYYKKPGGSSSTEEELADVGMGFFSREIRDRVFAMLQRQQIEKAR